MKVLVTGATGFIGSEILKKLSEDKFEVAGTSKNGSKDSSLNIIKADISNIESDINKFTGNFDAVIHCAGLAHQFGNIKKELFDHINITGTKNVAELAVKLNAKHFILISSTAVYGYHKEPISELSECRPDTDYAKSKLEGEKTCREVCETNNVSLTILRLAPVLGEKGIGNIPRLIKAIDKKRFFWVGEGRNKKSLIYVGDIAGACLKILKNQKPGIEIFNLASEPVEMRELVAVISETLNKKIPKISVPEFIPNQLVNMNAKIIRSKFLERYTKTIEKWLSDDIYLADKIKEKYNFKSEMPISEAVKKQCLWYLDQKK